MRPALGPGNRSRALTPRPAASLHPAIATNVRPRAQSLQTRREAIALGLLRFSGLMILAASAAGCGRSKTKVKGKAPKGEPSSLLAVMAGDTAPNVTIRGKMIEKCPTAGCWFRLQDGDRQIKVDTKTAGFVVTDIPLETLVTVGGRVAQENGETILEATGLRY